MSTVATASSTKTPPHTLPQANDPCWCGSGRKYKRCHKAGEGRVRPGRVSPPRPVPEGLTPTEYHATGHPTRTDEAMVKAPEVIAAMRRVGHLAAEVLAVTGAAVRPGITTDELDAVAHAAYLERGLFPSTLNYHGYPKSICTSVNEVICHGIPDLRPLEEGDIVNLDVTIYLEGMHGDLSETVGVGTIDEESTRLIRITHECLMRGIGAVRPGGMIRDIGRAIQEHATRNGVSVVKAFVGHGVGEQFHMDPQVPHYFDEDARTEMLPGMTFTIEPMINLGTWKHLTWDDNWTAVTADLQRSAQFEHTIHVTERGVEILTLPEGQPQPFAH